MRRGLSLWLVTGHTKYSQVLIRRFTLQRKEKSINWYIPKVHTQTLVVTGRDGAHQYCVFICHLYKCYVCSEEKDRKKEVDMCDLFKLSFSVSLVVL